jgi:ABC-type transporter Mla MlaB component
MLICVAEARAVGEPVVAARDLNRAVQDLDRTAPLKLRHRICLTGEAVVDLHGELDIASAEAAVSYVRDITDRHHGPVTVDLTALDFCDAQGLAALVRMAGHAEQNGAAPGRSACLSAPMPGGRFPLGRGSSQPASTSMSS